MITINDKWNDNQCVYVHLNDDNEIISYVRYSSSGSILWKKTLARFFLLLSQIILLPFANIYVSIFMREYKRSRALLLAGAELMLICANLFKAQTHWIVKRFRYIALPVAVRVLLSRCTHFACLSAIRKRSAAKVITKYRNLFIDRSAREKFQSRRLSMKKKEETPRY